LVGTSATTAVPGRVAACLSDFLRGSPPHRRSVS
jgi:hypothetical protein